MDDERLYGDRAGLYDLIYHWKDYAAEAEGVHALLAAEGVPEGGRVVEAACGTASYLPHLGAWYQVSGFDRSEAMLAAGREKVPGVRLWQADMQDFALEDPADAVVCLFSSIGYLQGPEALARFASACFAALKAGGVLLVEPWFVPEEIDAGRPTVQTYDGDDLKLVRAVVTQVDGRRSIFPFHWLVLRRGHEVEHFVERHVLWSFTWDEMLAAFRAAGFEARREDEGMMPGRGLLVARRPGP